MDYILGDNPFFGVNHRVGSKALATKDERFEKATEVIIASLNNGFSGFMLSSHSEGRDLIEQVTDRIIDTNLKLKLALVIPYPHTINDLVAEHGYFRSLAQLRNTSGPGLIFDFSRLLFMGKSALRRSFISSYIAAEIKNFENRSVVVDAICLHNVVTDLFLGLRRIDLLEEYIECCQLLGVKPVLISQNPVATMSLNTEIDHIICFTYNSLGYMVNPGLEIVKKSIVANQDNIHKKLWAMQILASGNLSSEQALKDPLLNYFDGILYATTQPARITSFVNQIEDYLI